MLARDFAGKGILISKVIDIVNELSASLNMDKGGSLAVNLNNLYILCTARLLQANLKMNVESLDSVVHILSGLRGAYAQIIETGGPPRGGGNSRAHAARGLGHENRPAHHAGAGDGGAARPCPGRLRQKRHAARHPGGRPGLAPGSGGAGPCAEFRAARRAGRPCCRPPARSLRQA